MLDLYVVGFIFDFSTYMPPVCQCMPVSHTPNHLLQGHAVRLAHGQDHIKVPYQSYYELYSLFMEKFTKLFLYHHKTNCFIQVKSRAVDTGWNSLFSHIHSLRANEGSERVIVIVICMRYFVDVVEKEKYLV